ncbi:MAG: hypothetical protein FP810_03980 [Desulfocapsa sp.]|nr:hypothetical protein [Desulfocapsa sp.]
MPSNDVAKKEESIERPWPCAGCGVLVSLEESLCPACTAQLYGGGLGWGDDELRITNYELRKVS